MKRFLIIPTAGQATRLSPLNAYYPKALIPLGDEPVVARILNLYAKIQIDKVILVVSPNDCERFERLKKTYQAFCQIVIVVQVEPLGLLPAIYAAKEELLQADEVCIHLADTLLSKSFKEKDFASSFILAGTVKDSAAWAMVTSNDAGELVNIIDKPAKSDLHLAVTGVYFLKHGRILQQALESTKGQTDISAALMRYKDQDGIQVRISKDWQDIGDIKNLHAIKESFSTYKQAAVFREDVTIVKKSSTTEIEREQYFYRHVRHPELFPRLLGRTSNKLRLSYQPLRSLAYYALFEDLTPAAIQHIFTNLLTVLNYNFYSSPCHWSAAKEQTLWMYGQRILELVQKDIEELAGVKYWLINGEKVLGFCEIKETILTKAKYLARTAVIRHIHGDLHLANILHDPLSNTFTFIDPRGMWGNQYSIYGDIRYDLAKLLHSLHGGYEYIKRGLTSFKETGHNAFTFHLPADHWLTFSNLQGLFQQYEITSTDVLWIEALCFLSMVRCYTDPVVKRKFFLRGLYLINQLL